MESTGHQSPKWNIFARELESMLQRRGLRLGHLNDRSQIHPEKVRRLQRSLNEPRFHLLSPEEVEHVSATFGFSADERLRLRAAILATAVEDLLMDRIDTADALAASDQVFDILLGALQAQGGDGDGIGAVKGELQMNGNLAGVPNKQDAFEEAVANVGRAYLTMHLALAEAPAARLRMATRARDEFIHATAALKQLDTSFIEVDERNFWRDEAERGLARAEAYIDGINT